MERKNKMQENMENFSRGTESVGKKKEILELKMHIRSEEFFDRLMRKQDTVKEKNQ